MVRPSARALPRRARSRPRDAWASATVACIAAAALVAASQAYALVFLATADPAYNASAPGGALAGSGWQWVGGFGGFQGTPIGPRHFLAARHIGVPLGTSLVLDGASYPTTAFFDDANSDLRIWQIDGTFPSWATLYRGSSEVGRTVVVFGRGAGRGGEVRNSLGELRGWLWGGGAGALRWGQNTLAAVVNGGTYWGPLLYATFDQGGGANEVHLAGGDSSAPAFVQDGGAWRLAGVAASVDAYFNTTNSGQGFAAALFDTRGLHTGPTAEGPWSANPVSGPTPKPTGFYLTRVSARAGWIDSILARRPQSIDFPPLGERAITDSPFEVRVSASSGLPVEIAVVAGPASVAGSTVTLTGLGSVTLRATQAGDGSYLPATPVERGFNVVAARQVPALSDWATVLLGLALLAAARRVAIERRAGGVSAR